MAVDTTPIDQLLRYLWDNQATDLHLCAGHPPRVRIDGKLWAIPEAEPITVEFMDGRSSGLMSHDDQDDLPRGAPAGLRLHLGRARPGSAPTPSSSSTARRWRCG